MRIDRILTAVFVVLVSTAIIGFSAGSTGASFTGTTTNPAEILNTQNVTPPASFSSATSAVGGQINLAWTASASPAGGHALSYLVLRGPVGGPYVQIGTTAALTYSDTPGADGTYQYVIQTKIAQGAGFFTSGNSATKNGISDRVAPAMSILCNGAACGGWKNSSTVQVSGVDGGSGMASVTYKIDAGANVVTNAASVSFNPTDGTHTITYFGTDVAGNVQSSAVQTVKIDTTAPTAAGAPFDNGTAQNNGQIAVSWTLGSDAGSGVASQTLRRSGVRAGACPAVSTANYPTVVAGIGVATTSKLISGLASGKNYCFYVVTTDNVGNASNSAASAPIQAQ